MTQGGAYPRHEFSLDERHRYWPVVSRVSRYLGVVAAHPDVASGHDYVLRRRCELACWVDTHDVTREAYQSFAHDASRIERGDEGDEVAALEAFGIDPSFLDDAFSGYAHGRDHRRTRDLSEAASE